MKKTSVRYLDVLRPVCFNTVGRMMAGLLLGGLLAGTAAWGQQTFASPYSFTTIAGVAGEPQSVDGTNAGAWFESPAGMAMDTNGVLYVVDNFANVVREVAPVGTNWVVTTIAGTADTTGNHDGMNQNARFNEPQGIAADLYGNLYVADSGNNTIRQMTLAGTNWSVATIAGGAQGASDGTGGSASFNQPLSVAVDTASNLYVVDSENSTIRKITPGDGNWVVTTIAGAANNTTFKDGTNGVAAFNNPSGIALDRSGNLFVADTYNYAIRKIAPVGTNWVVTTIAGAPGTAGTVDGTNKNAQFAGPYGIAVDANDNLFVADSFGPTIREITPVGTNWVTTTLAGTPGPGGSSDGVGPNAQFNFPWGIVVNAADKVFVADNGNSDIRAGVNGASVQVPNLSISLMGGNTVGVSWPGSGFTLHFATDLARGDWADYPATVSNSNGTNFVTFPQPVGNLFFRLSFP